MNNSELSALEQEVSKEIEHGKLDASVNPLALAARGIGDLFNGYQVRYGATALMDSGVGGELLRAVSSLRRAYRAEHALRQSERDGKQ